MTQMLRGARRLALPLLLAAAPLAGCDLTVEDTNATTEDDAYGTRQGLLAGAVGLQAQYNVVAYDNLVLTTGISSRELAADNTFANLLELDAGGAGLDPSNANVGGYFNEMYQTISTANAIIEGAATADGVEDELRAGLTALAQFYKGAAIGALSLGFTDIALSLDDDNNGVYVSRQEALGEAVSLFAQAEGALGGGALDALGRVTPDGFDLLNSVRAYRARYALYAGDLEAAAAAASSVDLGATSVFVYSATEENPLYQAISPDLGQPSFAVRDNLGLEDVEDGDGRIDYFTEDNDDESVNGFPIETATGFIAAGPSVALPVYVPDEMKLIRAEVAARRGDTATAVALINEVRTDTDDPFGLAAGLDEYDGGTSQDALLAEIYYNRSTELYLQGLRLADQRRFGLGDPDPTNAFARTRNFYPFPQQERLANGNTPADPAI